MQETLTRTQRRQKATKERIFRVAMELFESKGFDNTTVAEITEAADIGKGTFFTYFPTKEAIFRQLGASTIEDMTLAAQTGLETKQPLAETLRNVLTISIKWHEENKFITRQMTKSNLSFSLDSESSNKGRLLELLAQLIQEGQKNGEFNADLNAQNAATVLAGTYFTVLAIWAVSEDGSLQDRMDASIDVILKGLLA